MQAASSQPSIPLVWFSDSIAFQQAEQGETVPQKLSLQTFALSHRAGLTEQVNDYNVQAESLVRTGQVYDCTTWYIVVNVVGMWSEMPLSKFKVKVAHVTVVLMVCIKGVKEMTPWLGECSQKRGMRWGLPRSWRKLRRGRTPGMTSSNRPSKPFCCQSLGPPLRAYQSFLCLNTSL